MGVCPWQFKLARDLLSSIYGVDAGSPDSSNLLCRLRRAATVRHGYCIAPFSCQDFLPILCAARCCASLKADSFFGLKLTSQRCDPRDDDVNGFLPFQL